MIFLRFCSCWYERSGSAGIISSAGFEITWWALGATASDIMLLHIILLADKEKRVEVLVDGARWGDETFFVKPASLSWFSIKDVDDNNINYGWKRHCNSSWCPVQAGGMHSAAVRWFSSPPLFDAGGAIILTLFRCCCCSWRCPVTTILLLRWHEATARGMLLIFPTE